MAATAPKRSLFSKPSWASSKSATAHSAPSSIFGNRVYEGILEADRRRKEEETAKAKAQAEREESETRSSEPESKRCRIFEDIDGDNLGAQQNTKDKRKDRNTKESRRRTRKRLEDSLDAEPASSRKQCESPDKSKESKAVMIELSDDDAEEDPDMYESPATKSAPRSSPKKPESKGPLLDDESDYDDDDDDDDEYTRELKRKAKKRVLPQRSGGDAEQGAAASPTSAGLGLPSGDQHADFAFDASTHGQQPAQKPAEDDPLIRILIDPAIPNAKPLIVNRRASQTMKLVKEFWCKRQGFDNQMTAKVFLTWRGNRLWNSSTMQGPLRQLKKERPSETFNIEEEEWAGEGLEQKGARIELQAMTEETYQEYLRNQERKATAATRQASAGIDGRANDDEDDEGYVSLEGRPRAASAVQDDNKITIQLVCREHPPMFLRVRRDTAIGNIMAAFKKTKQLDTGKTPWLTFDGRRLEPEMTVTDAELEHEDTVEVHVR